MIQVNDLIKGLTLACVSPEAFAKDLAVGLLAAQGRPAAVSKYDPVVREGVAELVLSGSMARSSSWFGDGTDMYERWLEHLYRDASIEAIVLRINSGGGEAQAGFHLAQVIESRNKPVIVHTDYAASAAYLAASAADEMIVAPEYAEVGSLGVVYVIDEWADAPVSRKIIRSAISPEKLKDYEDALAGDYTAMQASADEWGKKLATAIARNRFGASSYKTVENWKEIMSGRLFGIDEAKRLGLVDMVGDVQMAYRRAKKLIQK